jgi:hypothetical protein
MVLAAFWGRVRNPNLGFMQRDCWRSQGFASTPASPRLRPAAVILLMLIGQRAGLPKRGHDGIKFANPERAASFRWPPLLAFVLYPDPDANVGMAFVVCVRRSPPPPRAGIGHSGWRVILIRGTAIACILGADRFRSTRLTCSCTWTFSTASCRSS